MQLVQTRLISLRVIAPEKLEDRRSLNVQENFGLCDKPNKPLMSSATMKTAIKRKREK